MATTLNGPERYVYVLSERSRASVRHKISIARSPNKVIVKCDRVGIEDIHTVSDGLGEKGTQETASQLFIFCFTHIKQYRHSIRGDYSDGRLDNLDNSCYCYQAFNSQRIYVSDMLLLMCVSVHVHTYRFSGRCTHLYK